MRNDSNTLRNQPSRRAFVMGMAAGMAVPGAVWAQAWPSRPIKIIAAQQAGALNDLTARGFAEYASRALKESVVVENRPGGLGMIAASAVATAPPDGHTLLLILASQLAQAQVLLKRPPVDGARDLTPLAAFAVGASPLCVHKDVPARNIRELIALARTKPVSVGNFSVGSAWQIMVTQLAKQTGAQFTIINYKGTSAMVQDLMAGVIQVGAGALTGMQAGIQANAIRPILMVSEQASRHLPGIPTWRDEGFVGPAFQDLLEANMLMAHANLPVPIGERLAAVALEASSRSESLKTMFTTMGVEEDQVLAGAKLTAMTARIWPAYQTLTRQLNLETQ